MLFVLFDVSRRTSSTSAAVCVVDGRPVWQWRDSPSPSSSKTSSGDRTRDPGGVGRRRRRRGGKGREQEGRREGIGRGGAAAVVRTRERRRAHNDAVVCVYRQRLCGLRTPRGHRSLLARPLDARH